MSEALDAKVAARRRPRWSRACAGSPNGPQRRSAAPHPAAADEQCDLCGKPIDHDHRHLLHLVDRRILCTCESCWRCAAGDPELRPTGTRTVWLDDFDLPDEIWASFGIPIGLAFFIDSSGHRRRGRALSEPRGGDRVGDRAETWNRLRTLNPVLMGLEPDAEALIVNRMVDPPQHAIAPIDECYRLVGLVKVTGRGSRAAPGSSGRSPGSSTSCGRRRA